VNIKEVASLLGVSRELAKLAIEEGVQTPSGTRVRLRAVTLADGPDVSEQELDAYIALFEAEEPGRHPPTAVRRELLIESGYKCSVCRSDGPLDYHHILTWAAIQHHDAQHMLIVCANCHAKITRYGQIDSVAQKQIKQRLRGEKEAAIQASARAAAQPSAPSASVSEPRPADLAPPQAQLKAQATISVAVELDPAAMKQIFAIEITFRGPSDDELQWIANRLFVSKWHTRLSKNVVVVLRTLRAITEIQTATHPDGLWTAWTYTSRLEEVAANILSETGVDPLQCRDAAESALEDARKRDLLQFEDVDEWHPGMASGSGWVEKVTLSRIGQKILDNLDAQ
jgi:hypothetical protein